MVQLYHRVSRLQARPVMIPSGVVPSVSGSDIVVDWNSVATADSYNVYTSIDGGTWTLLGNSATTSYTFTPTVPGEYNFRVTSVRGTQESAPSAETLYDEMMEQVYSDTITGLRISAVDGTAFVDAALGPELVTGTNSDMSGANSWESTSLGTLDVNTTVSGKMYMLGDGGLDFVSLPAVLTVGKKYRMSFKARLNSGASTQIRAGNTSTADNTRSFVFTPTSTESTFTGDFEATNVNAIIGLASGFNGVAFEIDDVSIKEILIADYTDGNHLLEIEDSLGNVASGVLSEQGSGEVLGAELVTNKDFSAWTGDNPDGWTVVEDGDASSNVTEDANGCQIIRNNDIASIQQNVLSLYGLYYSEIDVHTANSGSFIVGFGSLLVPHYSGTHSSVGIKTMRKTSVGDYCRIYAYNNCNVVLASASVKQVTAPSTSGALIVSEIDGATQNFVSIPAGFAFNQSSYICRVKKILPTA